MTDEKQLTSEYSPVVWCLRVTPKLGRYSLNWVENRLMNIPTELNKVPAYRLDNIINTIPASLAIKQEWQTGFVWGVVVVLLLLEMCQSPGKQQHEDDTTVHPEARHGSSFHSCCAAAHLWPEQQPLTLAQHAAYCVYPGPVRHQRLLHTPIKNSHLCNELFNIFST